MKQLRINSGWPEISRPAAWRYVSLTPSTRFPIPDLFEIEWSVARITDFFEKPACDAGTPIVHFSSGAGSLERGFGSGSDILTDGVSVYRRIMQKEAGKTVGSSGLKIVRNKHIVWFIRKINLPISDVQPMLDEVT